MNLTTARNSAMIAAWFVEVTKEEFENFELESTRTIEIEEFVDRTEIDPRYLIGPHYL